MKFLSAERDQDSSKVSITQRFGKSVWRYARSWNVCGRWGSGTLSDGNPPDYQTSGRGSRDHWITFSYWWLDTHEIAQIVDIFPLVLPKISIDFFCFLAEPEFCRTIEGERMAVLCCIQAQFDSQRGGRRCCEDSSQMLQVRITTLGKLD